MLLDGLERRLVHGGHARTVVLPGKTGDVDLERDGTNRRTEVVQAHLTDAKPGKKSVGV